MRRNEWVKEPLWTVEQLANAPVIGKSCEFRGHVSGKRVSEIKLFNGAVWSPGIDHVRYCPQYSPWEREKKQEDLRLSGTLAGIRPQYYREVLLAISFNFMFLSLILLPNVRMNWRRTYSWRAISRSGVVLWSLLDASIRQTAIQTAVTLDQNNNLK